MTIMNREDELRLMVFMFAIVVCYCWSRWSPGRDAQAILPFSIYQSQNYQTPHATLRHFVQGSKGQFASVVPALGRSA